ncbi:hypothetical protein H7H51_23235 [Mycolicibacterium farcinogenes]|nr:hypothetical protein [Mycolicibacterium farcinogenes]
MDAAARLNRASYAAWDATAAAMMAFAGLWLSAAAWVLFLLLPQLAAHRTTIVAAAAFTIVVVVAGAVGPPVIAVGIAMGWVLAAPYGVVGLACGCAVLLGLTAACYRVVGAGHWSYVTAAVPLGAGAVAFAALALGAPVAVVATVAVVVAVFGCLAVPALTARLDQYPVPDVGSSRTDDPFASVSATPERAPGTPMPSARRARRCRAPSRCGPGSGRRC